MAKLISKTEIGVGTELTIDTSARTIELILGGGLVAVDGAAWQAVYTKFVDLWTTDAYNDFPFPFYVIDVLSGQFAIGFDGNRYNDWKFVGSTNLYLRDGGWDWFVPTAPGADGTSATGTIATTFPIVISLGAVSVGSQLYYQLVEGGPSIDFVYADAVNLGVQVFGDAANGDFTSDTYLKGYCREYSKSYTESVLGDTGRTGTNASTVNLLLSNSDDLDIVNTDTDVIDAPISPYDKMKISYFDAAFSRDIDVTGTVRNFGVVIDCGTHSGVDGAMTSAGSDLTSATDGIVGADFVGGTLEVHEGTNAGTYTVSGTPTGSVITVTESFAATESTASYTLYPAAPLNPTLQQIYTFVQAKLRQAGDINDVTGGTATVGKTASLLLNFTAKLVAGFFAPTNQAGGGSGVTIEGVSNADSNSIELYDNTATKREFPYSSAGNWSYNSALVGAGSYYFMYFTTLPGVDNDYGEAASVIVDDADGNPITGTISGDLDFTFDFTNNAQGGRTPNSNAAVTLVTGRPGSAKPNVSTGILTESKAIVLASVAEADRAYGT